MRQPTQPCAPTLTTVRGNPLRPFADLDGFALADDI
jgi:hypothetical protein